MISRECQFMLVFGFPEGLTDELLNLLFQRRARVAALFEEGVLLSYALSLEHSRL